MLTEFKRELAESLSQLTGREGDFVLGLLESPKNISHGHMAFPVFFMAREKRMAPPLIAKELAVGLEELVCNLLSLSHLWVAMSIFT